MKNIRLGVIGYGFMGRTHSWGCRSLPFFYQDLPFTVELAAVASPSEQSRQRAAAEGGFGLQFADWRELIERRDIDAVTISSPNGLHRDMLLAAIAAGKHVYVDKPLVVDYSETPAIIDALKNSSIVHQMVFHNRFYPSAMRARELIAEGRLGQITSFRGRYLHSGSIYADQAMGWKQRGGEGGVLLDLGAHIIDLLYFLLGEVSSVWGTARALYPQRPLPGGGSSDCVAEDQCLLTVALPCGACGTLEASKIATGIDDELKIEIHGTKGAIILDFSDVDHLWFFDESDRDVALGGERGFKKIRTALRYPAPCQFPSFKNASGWLRGHLHCMYSFLSSVSEGKQAQPDIYDGIYIQRVMDAAKRSFQSGKVEQV